MKENSGLDLTIHTDMSSPYASSNMSLTPGLFGSAISISIRHRNVGVTIWKRPSLTQICLKENIFRAERKLVLLTEAFD
ncbi:unnamed protein product [Caretta caretta]